MGVVAIYYRSAAACTPQHLNIAEEAIHVWPTLSSSEGILVQLEYRSHGEVQNSFPEKMDAMKVTSWASAEQRAMVTDDGTSVRVRALCPEPKGVVRTQDVIRVFMST